VPGATYFWSTGADTPIITVTPEESTTYSVAVMANACIASDVLMVSVTELPAVDLGPDEVVCPGQSLLLDATVPGATYLWSTGAMTPTITVSPLESTTYAVSVTANGCTGTDAILLTVDPCLGLEDLTTRPIRIRPVPVHACEVLYVENLKARDVLAVVGADGRAWPVRIAAQEGTILLDVSMLPPGTFVLRTSRGASVRFSVVD
jgi:hypothetical protein